MSRGWVRVMGKIWRNLVIRFSFAVGVSVFGGDAYAQAIFPEVPGTIDPGRIPEQVLPPPIPAGGDIEIEVKPQDSLEAPEGAESIRFRLRSVEIEGSTVLHSDELQATYESRIDEDVTLSDVYQIAQAIQGLYNQKGYFLSRVFVPEQRIVGGQVRIGVVEGFIESIDFADGMSERAKSRLRPYLNRIASQRPLKRQTIERNLLLMNDLAGFQVSASISAGRQPGGAVLTVSVNRKLASPYFELNNWASETVGPVRMQGGVFLNSPFWYGERITIGGATALPEFRELANSLLQVAVPIGSSGLTVNTGVNYTETQPGANLRKFKLKGRSFNYSFGVSYPIIRSREQNLTFTMGFDLTNSTSETRFLGPAIALYNDRVRTLQAGIRYQGANALGVTGVSVEFSQGVDWFGTTFGGGKVPISRANGDPTAFTAKLDGLQVFSLPNNMSLSLSFTGQLASNGLLSTEQFGVGGPNFGSAYNFSQITGDAGYAMRLELERAWFTQAGNTPIILRPYTYFDYGQTFLIKPLPVEKPSKELASAGIGLRANISNFLQGRAELAFPFQKVEGIANPRIVFSLQGVF